MSMDEIKDKVTLIRKGKDDNLAPEEQLENLAIKLVLTWMAMMNPDIVENFSPADCSALKNYVVKIISHLRDHPDDFNGAADLLTYENWPIFRDED